MALQSDEPIHDLASRSDSRISTSLISRLPSAARLDRNYIGGECVLPAGQAQSAVIDPSTEETVAETAPGNAQDVAVAVAEALRAFAAWSGSSPQSRAAPLDRVHRHRIVRPHRLNEFMHLLAGGVRFASPDGSVLSARAGDAPFVPQGAQIGWESRERVAKFNVVQEART
jgi:hypothetical protein